MPLSRDLLFGIGEMRNAFRKGFLSDPAFPRFFSEDEQETSEKSYDHKICQNVPPARLAEPERGCFLVADQKSPLIGFHGRRRSHNLLVDAKGLPSEFGTTPGPGGISSMIGDQLFDEAVFLANQGSEGVGPILLAGISLRQRDELFERGNCCEFALPQLFQV